MHTIKLIVEDSIYQNIMFLLKNLKLEGLKIEDSFEKNNNTKENVKELFNLKTQNLFEDIKDPMQWQNEARDEWK